MPGHNMPASPSAQPQGGHDMPTMPGMQMPAALGAQPQGGHDMGNMPGMQMPGHDMGNMAPVQEQGAVGTNLPAGHAPPPPAPQDHAADTIYGPEHMVHSRDHMVRMHGGRPFYQVMLNLAEYRIQDGRDSYHWDGQAWYGGDINRLFVTTQGEGEANGSIERAEVQALFSHAIGAYFNVQGGVRYDFQPTGRAYAAVGIEGLAPSFFEVEGFVFLSDQGDVLARAEGYYDQRITQRLILQPRVEANFAAQDVPESLTGAGLSDIELGLRLRYDIRREFAPYVGVVYERSFAAASRYRRAAGEDTGGFALVLGVRTWF